LLKLLYIRTEQLIERQWYAVEAVALAVLERETMTGDQVHEICRVSESEYDPGFNQAPNL
jgi:hypothetical protein